LLVRDLVLCLHAFATVALVGLIWTIQLVHYPLFAAVGREGFPAYEAAHARRITPLVGTLMLVELLTAALLVVPGLVALPDWMPAWIAWAGLGLVGTAWATTAFVSIPCHAILARGFDAAAHRRLVATNWIRTIAWTLRGFLATAMLL
jgi:hypothetical protein